MPDAGSQCVVNGTTDGDEVDVDCGGSCGACDGGKKCKVDADCQSKACNEHGVCAGFTASARIDDPSLGDANRNDSLYPLVEDADGVPVAVYPQRDAANASSRLYARAFINLSWEKTATSLSPAAEVVDQLFNASRAAVSGDDLLMTFVSGSGSLYAIRRHAGAFEPAALVAQSTQRSYLRSNGTDRVVVSEIVTQENTPHVAASAWNGTAFPTLKQAESGDGANLVPSQTILADESNWNGWVVFGGNTSAGGRVSIYATRWNAGAWTTPAPLDLPTDAPVDPTRMGVITGAGSEATVAFLQNSGGTMQLRVNHIADGATTWDGATTVSPATTEMPEFGEPKFVSPDGSLSELLVLSPTGDQTELVAAHATNNQWSVGASITPVNATKVVLESVARLDGATGALVCYIATIDGKKDAWVTAYQSGAWTTPVPVLPPGTGSARSCTIVEGNRVLTSYNIGDKSSIRVARWAGGALSTATAVGTDEASSRFMLLPATTAHPPQLVFLTDSPGQLYVADWPDAGVQTPRRIDDSVSGVGSFSATNLASGRAGFLYRDGASTPAVYAVLEF